MRRKGHIKIVVNAGGLNPKGMAEETSKILRELGVDSQGGLY